MTTSTTTPRAAKICSASGDVGQEKREEVDYAPAPLLGAGANYGWNCREGSIAGPATDPECATPPSTGFAAPAFDYPHTATAGATAPCAIIGGYVVRDQSLGQLYGRYLYGDLCVGELRSVDLTNPGGGDRSGGIRMTNLNSFGEDSCGRIYAVEGGGQVYRLVGPVPASCPPPASSAAQPLAGAGVKSAAATFVGIRARPRRVERGRRAMLTVWVSPCAGRKGKPVQLLRNGRPNGTRFLSRACTANFVPRIRRGTTFVAASRAERGYLAGRSRQLTIRLAHPKRHR